MRVKVIKRSKYKGVSFVKDRLNNTYWSCRGKVKGNDFTFLYDTEIEAAKQYDKVMITNGLAPVNILKLCDKE